jgi:6-phosphogluconolactonase (cycloisomerase 2 family)
MDFHPSGKWVYITLERQNRIHVYRRMPDGTLSNSPLFVKSTLTEPDHVRPTQTAASIHVHPNGRFLYVANRASGTEDFEGKQVFVGGENTIAVYSIDQETGEPTLIQSIYTRGFQPRTFALDSGGSFLAVANQSPGTVHDQSGVRTVPASLALYRVRDDGKLEFARNYDIETGAKGILFWAGFETLP